MLAACDSATEFTCMNGQCIPISYKQDGLRDCTDNSDEGEWQIYNVSRETYIFTFMLLLIMGEFCPRLLSLSAFLLALAGLYITKHDGGVDLTELLLKCNSGW